MFSFIVEEVEEVTNRCFFSTRATGSMLVFSRFQIPLATFYQFFGAMRVLVLLVLLVAAAAEYDGMSGADLLEKLQAEQSEALAGDIKGFLAPDSVDVGEILEVFSSALVRLL